MNGGSAALLTHSVQTHVSSHESVVCVLIGGFGLPVMSPSNFALEAQIVFEKVEVGPQRTRPRLDQILDPTLVSTHTHTHAHTHIMSMK